MSNIVPMDAVPLTVTTCYPDDRALVEIADNGGWAMPDCCLESCRNIAAAYVRQMRKWSGDNARPRNEADIYTALFARLRRNGNLCADWIYEDCGILVQDDDTAAQIAASALVAGEDTCFDKLAEFIALHLMRGGRLL